MNNKDKLICLFESEGFNVNEFKELKKEAILGNRERTEFISNEKGEVNRKVVNVKQQNYQELCETEWTMKNAEEDIYESFPTNPYIYNYKNTFLRGQRICDCLLTYDGQPISLEQFKKTNISSKTKDEVFKDLKRSWILETKNYVSSRKQQELIYLEREVYDQTLSKKRSSLYSIFFWIMMATIFFLIAYTNILDGQEEWFSNNIFYDNKMISGSAFLFWVTLVFIFGKIGYYNISKSRVIDKVSDKYNSLYDDIDKTISKLSIKQMTQQNILAGFPNYREKSDQIDKKYVGGKKSKTRKKGHFYEVILSIAGLMLFIGGCINIPFWIVIIVCIIAGILEEM